MERRARSRRRARDRRERGGSVRSRRTSGTWTSETSPTPSRRSRISTPARREWRRARRAAPPRPRGGDARPRRAPRSARSSCRRRLRTTSPIPEPVLRRGGILTVAFRLAPSDELADRLFARVSREHAQRSERAHVGRARNDARRHAMHEWTGEQRWRDAWAESADVVRSRRDEHGLWTQHLGKAPRQRMLGAAHGAVSNQLALLQGSPIEDARDVARHARANRDRRRAARQLADGRRAAPRTQGPDPGAVVPRRTGDRHSRRPRTSRRSSCSPAQSSRGRPARTRRGPGSATARRATATRC